jgi:uncharacterized protein (TIRG00374 family)
MSFTASMDWKKILPVIGIVILVYVLWRFNLEKIIAVFHTVNPVYAALGFLALPITLLLINIEWQMILKRQHIHASFSYTMKNLLIGYFYGIITPGGFGNFLRAVYLKQETNTPIPKGISNILTNNIIDYTVVFVFSAIGGLFLLGRYPYLFLLILILLFGLISVFIFFIRQKTSKNLFQRLLRTQIFQLLQRYMDDQFDSFFGDVPTFRSLLLPFLFSFFNWAVFFTELYLIAQIFSIHIPYVTSFFIIAITATVATLPISIYGLGTRDATLVALLSLYGLPAANSISFTLFWFTVFWITPSIIGAVLTVAESKKLPPRKKPVKNTETMKKEETTDLKGQPSNLMMREEPTS